MKNVYCCVVASIWMLLLPTNVQAFCLDPLVESRVQAYCLSGVLSSTATDIESARLLDFRLKQEGYRNGLGLPGRVSDLSFSPYILPLLEYNSDINGGNPDKPLELGTITFFGDESFFKKEGFVAGIGVGGSGRTIYGAGSYFDFGVGASYLHSFEHEIGIARAFANVCSKNDIGGNFYLDGCLSSNWTGRELKEDLSSTASLSVARLFAIGNSLYGQASVGIRRAYESEFEQNQIVIKSETLHRSGFSSAINVSLGEDLQDTLAMNHSLSASVGNMLFGNPISATVSYSYADGGKLLGFDREETTRQIRISYSFNSRFNVSVGYREVESNIDFFDQSEAIWGLQYSPIRF